MSGAAEYGVVRRRESPRNIKDEPVALLGVLDGRRADLLLPMPFADDGDGAAAAILAGQGWRVSDRARAGGRPAGCGSCANCCRRCLTSAAGWTGCRRWR